MGWVLALVFGPWVLIVLMMASERFAWFMAAMLVGVGWLWAFAVAPVGALVFALPAALFIIAVFSSLLTEYEETTKKPEIDWRDTKAARAGRAVRIGMKRLRDHPWETRAIVSCGVLVVAAFLVACLV